MLKVIAQETGTVNSEFILITELSELGECRP